jgi:hypothetical protein
LTIDYYQPEEAAELCKQLEAIEIDFVELSGGTYEDMAFIRRNSGARETTLKHEAFFTEVCCPRRMYRPLNTYLVA